MCDHLKFKAQVDVTRLTDDSGKVTGYATDVTVHCAECLKPFEWVGVPAGYGSSGPHVSADGLELRVPIKPVI